MGAPDFQITLNVPRGLIQGMFDRIMASFYSRQLANLNKFAEILTADVRKAAPRLGGLMAGQVDWRLLQLGDQKFSGSEKSAPMTGKTYWERIKKGGRYHKMVIEIGVLGTDGWGYDYPVPYGGIRNKGGTITPGGNSGTSRPMPSRGGRSLMFPIDTPLARLSGIYKRPPVPPGVGVYAREVLGNPKKFGLKTVFFSKSRKVLLGRPIGRRSSEVVTKDDALFVRIEGGQRQGGTNFIHKTLAESIARSLNVLVQ